MDATTLSLTSDESGTEVLDSEDGEELAQVDLTANAAATLDITAQNTATVASLTVADSAGNQTTAETGVVLGSDGEDTRTQFDDTPESLFWFGFDGDDDLVTLDSGDILDGGQGTDTLFPLSIGNETVTFDSDASIQNVEEISSIVGNSIDVDLSSQTEGFTIRVLNGDDVIRGSHGNDLFDVKVEENQGLTRGMKLEGAAGDDEFTILFQANFLLNDSTPTTIDGGEGQDTLVFVDYNGTTKGSATANVLDLDDFDGSTYNGDADAFDNFSNLENVDLSDEDSVSYTMRGTAGTNILTGGGGDDLLEGRAGDDQLSGGGGDDTLMGGAGADTLDGGAGVDTASYAMSPGAVTVDLTDNGNNSGAHAEGDQLSRIANLTGSGYGDTLTGNNRDNRIDGGAGDDDINAGPGLDTINGGAGADQIQGRRGDDIINGGDGDDTITGNAGADTIDGGAGADTYTAGDGTAISVTLNTDTAATVTVTGGEDDSIVNIENVIGTDGDDAITGSAGDDAIAGGAGADVIDGGKGSDTVSYADATKADGSVLAAGSAGITLALNDQPAEEVRPGDTNVGADTLTKVENIIGTRADDTLTGGTAANTLTGGGGDDTIDGRGGDDTITGGAGADTITGGAGDDQFAFAQDDSTRAAVDEITDFEISEDVLDFDDMNDTAIVPDVAEVDVGLTIGEGDRADVHADIINGMLLLSVADGDQDDLSLFDGRNTIISAMEKAVEEALGADDPNGAVVGFELDGDTYVIEWTYKEDFGSATLENVVQLSGITGISDLARAAADDAVVIA
ncbi:hypothetical protein BA897_09830 [Spiribacter roseus]|nr:hypothetical protein BA897_09830 [Spiribacter roseus]